MNTDLLTPDALNLILKFETGGQAFYERIYKSAPHWPGGSSGVTIGAGYDLGYERNFREDWKPYLTPAELDRLARTIGLTGSRAKQALSGVRDIKVKWEWAVMVFLSKNVPREVAATIKAFPQAKEKLRPNAFGALVSVVFNRGAKVDDSPRRKEMLYIRDAIVNPAMGGEVLHGFVSRQIKSMGRLWRDDPNSDGDLVDRRKAEAALVLKA